MDIASLLAPIKLQHILKKCGPFPLSTKPIPMGEACKKTGETAVLKGVSAPISSSELSQTRVWIEVGEMNNKNSIDSVVPPEAQRSESFFFDCPVFMLQFSSSTLSELLEEHLLTTKSSDSVSLDNQLLIKLPFPCTVETFETVALYIEHFYSVENVLQRPGSVTPTVFSTPLNIQDLYTLSSWEVTFVWQRLLGLVSLINERARQSLVDEVKEDSGKLEEKSKLPAFQLQWAEYYVVQALWVDALAAPKGSVVRPARKVLFRRTSSPDKEAFQEQEIAADATSQVQLNLTAEEKQTIANRILQVLELATQLRVLPLQSLCGALMANMLVDLDGEELRALLEPPVSTLEREESSSKQIDASTLISSMLPTPEAELVSRYPWIGANS